MGKVLATESEVDAQHSHGGRGNLWNRRREITAARCSIFLPPSLSPSLPPSLLLFYLHIFYAEFIPMPYVFVPSVSSGISFSSVQPPLLGLKQSVSFSEDHLSLAQGAHGWLICHELVSSSAYLRCFVHVTRSTTRESIA